ncbi:MAG: 3-isopropylmalate dehydratase small subunit, partial [Rhodospirillales bacterium]
PDFADIFYNNSFKNGMLLIKLPQDQVDQLVVDAGRGSNATVTVDLETQEIRRPDGEVIPFDIDPFKKHCLLNGLDDISLTLQKEDKLAAFEETRKNQPWL